MTCACVVCLLSVPCLENRCTNARCLYTCHYLKVCVCVITTSQEHVASNVITSVSTFAVTCLKSTCLRVLGVCLGTIVCV